MQKWDMASIKLSPQSANHHPITLMFRLLVASVLLVSICGKKLGEVCENDFATRTSDCDAPLECNLENPSFCFQPCTTDKDCDEGTCTRNECMSLNKLDPAKAATTTPKAGTTPTVVTTTPKAVTITAGAATTTPAPAVTDPESPVCKSDEDCDADAKCDLSEKDKNGYGQCKKLDPEEENNGTPCDPTKANECAGFFGLCDPANKVCVSMFDHTCQANTDCPVGFVVASVTRNASQPLLLSPSLQLSTRLSHESLVVLPLNRSQLCGSPRSWSSFRLSSAEASLQQRSLL
ncbi:hypothetical protein L596_022625 [Steinernema carpocapsae]|uniref:WAP domain-containing protein n=1 Tax=Steinernema carpocapsae TaxID=34508 RepID=A0A4U5MMN3_STECR|nr:hypothetical protein L596_022625 [Steinernema carpocapsae]